MAATLVTLSRFPDVLKPLQEALDQYEPNIEKILVVDGDEDFSFLSNSWQIIHVPQPFRFSRNVNIGWSAAKGDIVFIADDVRCPEPFVSRLRDVAYQYSDVGIGIFNYGGASPFVCGYFRRDMLDVVGQMDESFIGYGGDDNDFLLRMVIANYFVNESPDVVLLHPQNGTTYGRVGNVPYLDAERRYTEKWGNRQWTQEPNYLEWRKKKGR